MPVVMAENLVEATQDTGAFVQLSGVLKRVACKLSKTCNDLRLLSSGPQAGFGDIHLPARQAGSSIMPGKVNPVIPEVMNQVAFEVIGNDVTITMASEAGQLQLNAFEPIMGWSLHKSISHLTRACRTLQVNCVEGITPNHELLRRRVAESVTLVTALNPIIGYEKAALIAKTALAERRHHRRDRRAAGHHGPRRDGGAAGARAAHRSRLRPQLVIGMPKVATPLRPWGEPSKRGQVRANPRISLPRIPFSLFQPLCRSQHEEVNAHQGDRPGRGHGRGRRPGRHAQEDQGQRQRSRWACASPPAR